MQEERRKISSFKKFLVSNKASKQNGTTKETKEEKNVVSEVHLSLMIWFEGTHVPSLSSSNKMFGIK